MTSIRSLVLIGLCILTLICLPASSTAATGNDGAGPEGEVKGEILLPTTEPWSTVDHSNLEALQQDFDSGPEVTEACLSCHNQAAKQVQETIHWTWVCPADPQGIMGKNGLTMNNF